MPNNKLADDRYYWLRLGTQYITCITFGITFRIFQFQILPIAEKIIQIILCCCRAYLSKLIPISEWHNTFPNNSLYCDYSKKVFQRTYQVLSQHD